MDIMWQEIWSCHWHRCENETNCHHNWKWICPFIYVPYISQPSVHRNWSSDRTVGTGTHQKCICLGTIHSLCAMAEWVSRSRGGVWEEATRYQEPWLPSYPVEGQFRGIGLYIHNKYILMVVSQSEFEIICSKWSMLTNHALKVPSHQGATGSPTPAIWPVPHKFLYQAAYYAGVLGLSETVDHRLSPWKPPHGWSLLV